MNFPCCGGEMTAGCVQSSRLIYFTTDAHDFWFYPTGSDVMPRSRSWTRPACAAHHCRRCKKVVIDYSQGEA